ncbi:MAG: hypothetical protein LC745_05200, partial [Planctomycetia bacterium]|nr:hypothetical protein [Planctomycetia bacterium]
AASILLLLVLFALPGRRPTVRQVVLLLCFLPPALGTVRMVGWWVLATAPVLASLLAARWPRLAPPDELPGRPSVAAGAIVGLLSLAVALSLPGLDRYNPVVSLVSRLYPTQAELEAVVAHFKDRGGSGRVFSRFEWGEYLTWSLYPEYTVFMDGRIELYPDDVWGEYVAVTRGRADWQDVLDRYRVDALLLDDDYHGDLLALVGRSPAWEQSFRAGKAVLFLRRPTARILARP